MTEHDDERAVSRRYRELPREEPPARLDDAIRAHARRAGGARPAPLVPPTGRRSWHYPAAAAAVLVLAVAVTWQLQRQDETEALVASAPPPPAELRKEEPAASSREQQVPAPATPPAPPRRAEVSPAPKPEPSPVPAAQAPAPAAEAPATAAQAPAAARDQAAPMMNQRQMAESGEKRSMARAEVIETPEQWLERIAKLRGEGRHEDADKALAEFRKRYPGFRIPPEMLEKVEKK